MSEMDNRYNDFMVAGFGGQGALIVGRLVADTAMSLYNHVSFFPNYGASARGGDTECTVILSDEVISSPAIMQPMTSDPDGQDTAHPGVREQSPARRHYDDR
jgi:2-oxoglutarate ferredoxin oxidoreductase subunit gamma